MLTDDFGASKTFVFLRQPGKGAECYGIEIYGQLPEVGQLLNIYGPRRRPHFDGLYKIVRCTIRTSGPGGICFEVRRVGDIVLSSVVFMVGARVLPPGC